MRRWIAWLHLYHVHGRSICHSAAVGYSILSLALNSTKWDLCCQRELGEEQTKSRLKVLWRYLISLIWIHHFTDGICILASFSYFFSEVSHDKFHNCEPSALTNINHVNTPKKILRNHFVHCHQHYRQFSKSAKRIINMKTILSEKIREDVDRGNKENTISSETEHETEAYMKSAMTHSTRSVGSIFTVGWKFPMPSQSWVLPN